MRLAGSVTGYGFGDKPTAEVLVGEAIGEAESTQLREVRAVQVPRTPAGDPSVESDHECLQYLRRFAFEVPFGASE